MTPKYNILDNVQEGTWSYMYPNLKKQKQKKQLKTTKKTETTPKKRKGSRIKKVIEYRAIYGDYSNCVWS